MYLLKVFGRALGQIAMWLIYALSPYSHTVSFRVYLTSGKVLKFKFSVPTKADKKEAKLIKLFTEADFGARLNFRSTVIGKDTQVNLNPKEIAAIEVIHT
jgi:hypothetical protein